MYNNLTLPIDAHLKYFIIYFLVLETATINIFGSGIILLIKINY